MVLYKVNLANYWVLQATSDTIFFYDPPTSWGREYYQKIDLEEYNIFHTSFTNDLKCPHKVF